jgi:hypothetical protein
MVSNPSNTLLTISMITKEALRVLENNLRFAKLVNRQYDDKYAVEGAKIGTALNIRKPARYLGRSGATISSFENTVEDYTTLTLSTQFGVDLSFTSAELALELDDFSNRVLKPAVATVANKIDYDGLSLYKYVYNAVGTPGTTPGDLKTYLQANGALDDEACPQDGMRSSVINPDAQIEIVDALKGLFQSSNAISQQYRTGRMGTAVGLEWQMDQNVRVHTTGNSIASAVTVLTTVSTAGQATLNIQGLTASTGTVAVGDVFTVDTVYAVNPQSRASTGKLRKFVVIPGSAGTYGTVDSETATTTYTADASGYLTLNISPAIYIYSNAKATVDSYPAQNDVVTFLGANSKASPQNLVFHRDAFCLGMADLPLPRGVDMAGRVSDKQLGMSIRLVRQYDIIYDRFICRLDVLYGWTVLYPQLACRVVG